MKILVFITTCMENKEYLEFCIFHYEKSKAYLLRRFPNLIIDLGVADFGPKGETIYILKDKCSIHLVCPGDPMTINVNRGFKLADGFGFDYFAYWNDDIAVHETWLYNALFFMENMRQAGFVGSVYERTGWCLPTLGATMPEPSEGNDQILNISRLWWEFSCCMMRTQAIKDTGFMDTSIGNPVGYMSDNDYLLRMRLSGWETWKSNSLTAFHGKGISQIKHRRPSQDDKIRKQALWYLKLKWGIDLSDIKKEVFEPKFKLPFDGKSYKIISDDLIIIEEKEYRFS